MTLPTIDTSSMALLTPALVDVGRLSQLSATNAVLHVINGEHFSGAERVQQLLGKNLNEFGYQAHFACVKPGKFPDLCGLPDSQVSQIQMHGRFDLAVIGRIAALAKDIKAEMLHAHTPRTAMLTSMVARANKLPWVYHVHSPTVRDSSRGLSNRLNDWVEKLSIRNCDCLITVSQSLADELKRAGIHPNRIQMVANGVPDIAPIDADKRNDTKSWRLGILALMRPRKGVEVALRAMQLLSKTHPEVTLELIGGFESNEYQSQILTMIENLGIGEKVRWSGFTNDVATAIRRLDALVLPSLYGEGMPMVVLESMAAAVPVIATHVEGTPEVIRDGIEGYLAMPGDHESLCRAIQTLTADRDNWQQLSRNALIRHRQHYSDKKMAMGVATVYDRVLGLV